MWERSWMSPRSWFGRASRQRPQARGEAIEARSDTGLHPGLERRVPGFHRRVENGERDARLAFLLGQLQCVERLGPVAAPRLGRDEPLRRHDLPIGAAHLQLAAVGPTPDEV